MRAKKQLGQHFLKDEHVLTHMQQVIAPKLDESFVEIGPGFGALTRFILPYCKQLLAIEIDKDVIHRLTGGCEHLGCFSLLRQDALAVDFNTLLPDEPTYRLIGNLPYNISTPLIFHVLLAGHRIKDLHFMLQKEVVERMVAKSGNKTYGRLSVMVQYIAQVDSLFEVPPSAFSPAPKVDSAIVRLIPYQHKSIEAADENQFAQIVRLAFQQRRKMLRASLKAHFTELSLETAPVDLTLRPEQLNIADFVYLSDHLIAKTDLKGEL